MIITIKDESGLVTITVTGNRVDSKCYKWGTVPTCCGDSGRVLRAINGELYRCYDSPFEDRKVSNLVSHIVENLELFSQ